MDTRKVANEYRASRRVQLIQEHAQGTQSIKEFCSDHGITQNTFYYWQRKLREAVVSQLPAMTSTATVESEPRGWVRLADLPPQQSVEQPCMKEESTWVVVSGCWIEVKTDTSTEFLSKILKAVKEAC